MFFKVSWPAVEWAAEDITRAQTLSTSPSSLLLIRNGTTKERECIWEKGGLEDEVGAGNVLKGFPVKLEGK